MVPTFCYNRRSIKSLKKGKKRRIPLNLLIIGVITISSIFLLSTIYSSSNFLQDNFRITQAPSLPSLEHQRGDQLIKAVSTVFEKKEDNISPAKPSKNIQQNLKVEESQLTYTEPTQKKGAPGSKSIIAYAISITSCPVNKTTVFDGPAILGHSIHQNSIQHNGSRSKYDYSLYAFVHPQAVECSHGLELLGYEILVRDIPFDIGKIQSESYKQEIELNGCCGSSEFLKLWAYTLTNHDIVVHTDTDVMVLQPMDNLFDAMLDESGNLSTYSIPTMGGKPLPPKIDFVFTRDYLQGSRMTKDAKKFGVQGGFYVVRPNREVFHDLNKEILKGNYERGSGWGKKKYGGFWGSAQIQGFLSYFYGEIQPQNTVELNRCIYNTMVDDPPMNNGKCRTGEETCEDCRETPLSDMITVHMTTCWKPWHCPLVKPPHPPRCKEVHRAWFDFRKSLELSWGYDIPKEGWYFERTLGYCTKKGGVKKRYYVGLQMPNATVKP